MYLDETHLRCCDRILLDLFRHERKERKNGDRIWFVLITVGSLPTSICETHKMQKNLMYDEANMIMRYLWRCQ